MGSMKYSCAAAAAAREASPVRVRGFWMVATEVARVPAKPTWGRVRVRGEGGGGGYEGLMQGSVWGSRGTGVRGGHDG